MFVSRMVSEWNSSWIGLTYETKEGEYNWVTGEPYSYANWGFGLPSGDTGRDFVLAYGNVAHWLD